MRIPIPGPGRLTLVISAVVLAVMASPWRTNTERWVLGVAAAVAVLALVWWRGRFLTDIMGRRLAMSAGRNTHANPSDVACSATDARTTVALRLLDDGTAVPLTVISGYLERYGIRSDAIRVTRREIPGNRTTWIGLTVSAAANIAVLQARSMDLPLRDTAEVALRRLADHLRELGWAVSTTDVDVPDLLGPQTRERWRAVQDGSHGYVAAYAVSIEDPDDSLGDTLDRLYALEATELWTAVEITGTREAPRLAVACAVRTDDVPDSSPVPALRPQNGDHRRALQALHPLATERLVRT